MLLPDQTYEQGQQILQPLKAIRKILKDSIDPPAKDSTKNVIDSSAKTSAKQRVADDYSEDYRRTAEFFNNIPDFSGDPLGPFSLPAKEAPSASQDAPNPTPKTSADVLKECELFLFKHRIRPDFFCRYRKGQE